MSVTQKIAQNTIIQIGGKVISTALGLIGIGLLARYLGVERFGWYTTAITFLQFAGILIDFGLIPVTAQMLGAGKYAQNILLKNLLAYRFVTALVFFGITPLVALLFHQYPIEVKLAIALLSVSFLAIAMNQVLTGYFQKELSMQTPVLGEIVGRIVLVAGLLIGQKLQVSFLTTMGVIAAASLAYTTVLWLGVKRREPAGFRFDWPIWRAITITMWPIAVSVIFNVVYLKGDTILLSLYRSQTEVGLYGAAYRVIDILAQLAMLMMGVVLPILASNFARKNWTEFKEQYQTGFDSLMLLAVPVVFGIWLLAEPIMTFVAGPEFLASGHMLRILSLAIFGVYLGALFGHTAVAIGKQKATMWIYISDAIITLAGYLYVIPRFGWFGAATLTVFSELYAGILLALLISHYSPAKLNFKKFGKIIIASLLMVGALLLIGDFSLLLLIPVGALVYLGTLYVLGGFSLQNLRALFRPTTSLH